MTITTNNTLTTDQEIVDYLRDFAPWFKGMECNISVLRGRVFSDVVSKILKADFGFSNTALVVNHDYHVELFEYLSIYPEAEDNIATRKMVFERKKAKDEAAEIASLRELLHDKKYGSKVVTAQGTRRAVESLTLPELRAAKAQIDNHLRMQSMSVGDLRAQEAAKRSQRREDGYPPLPASMVLPPSLNLGNGQVSNGYSAVEMTPQLIDSLMKAPVSSAEYHFYRFCLRKRYGAKQIEERQRA